MVEGTSLLRKHPFKGVSLITLKSISYSKTLLEKFAFIYLNLVSIWTGFGLANFPLFLTCYSKQQRQFHNNTTKPKTFAY